MATNARVGIDIEVLGYEGAKAKMESLEAQMKGLSGHKTKVKLQAEVDNLKLNRQALRSHKVKLQADMTQVNKAIKKTSQEYDALRRKMNAPAAKKGLYDPKAYRDLFRLKSEMSDLNKQKISIKADLGKATSEINQTTAAINSLEAAMKRVKTLSLGQIFNKTSAMLAHTGQAIQSMGNALTRLTSPVRNMFRYMGLGAGFAAFNKVSEGLMSGFKRYDTMNNYAKSLEALGMDSAQKFVVGAGKAQTAIENLNDAVLGLPTGLDEIVAAQKIYAGATGEMVKSTKTAIAANNTFLASATDAKEQRVIQRYLASLASGAELTTMQWQSMGRIAPLAMKAVADELGVTTDELRKGKVAGQEFLDAFIKVGTEGKIQAAANVMKTTYEGLAANVQNAFSRMGEGMLKTLDEVFVAYNGRNLIQNLLGVDAKGNAVGNSLKGVIDSISESMQNWVRANPGKIRDFLDTLKGVDWKGLGKGFAEGMVAMADGISAVAKAFSGRSLKWLGKAAAWLMPLGSMLTAIGGLVKGSRFFGGGIVAGIMGIARFFTGLGTAIGAGGLAKFGTKIQKAINALKDFGKLKAATDTAEAAAKVAGKKALGLKAHVASIGKGLASLGGALVGVLAIGGTVALSVKMIRGIVKDLGTISDDMGNVDVDAMKKLGMWISIIGSAFAGLGAAAYSAPTVAAGLEAGILAVGAIITTISGFAWINSKLISGTVKNIADAVTGVGDIATGINNLNGVTVNTSGIGRVMSGITKAVKHLDELQDGSGAWISNSRAKQLKKKYDNIGSIVDTVKKVAQDLKKIADVDTYTIEQSGNKVIQITDKLGEIYDEVQASFDVRTKKDVKGAGRGAEIAGSITEMIATIKSSFDDLSAIADFDLDYRPVFGKIKSVIGRMKTLWDDVNRLFAEQGADSKGITAKTGVMGQGAKTGISKADVKSSELQAGWVTNIKAMMEQVRGVYDAVAAEGGMADIDVATFSTMLNRAGSILSQIGTKWGEWKLHFAKFKNAGKDAENIANVKLAVDSIKEVMATLASIGTGLQQGAYGQSTESLMPQFGSVDRLQQGGSATSFIDTALSNITSIMDKLKELSASIGSIPNVENLSSNMEEVKSAVSKIGDVMTTLTSLGEGVLASTDGAAFTAINNIKAFITRLGNALNVEALAGLQAQVDSFRTSVQGIFDALNSDFANVQVIVNIAGKVTGDKALVSRIKAADRAIRNAVDGIKTSYTKHITVNITASVNRPSLGLSTGGMVTPAGALYRSKGGSIRHGFPGRPRGTDTVPTWTTPGEYIQQKKAVDFWGIDFMRKVNRMDVRGVMRAMSAKAGSIVAGAKTTIINNNTTNNYNMNNHQNITTNNPNFAFRRSRWVGAI